MFCVAVGLLPSPFISLHLDKRLGDTMVLLQVNKVFKPPHPPPRDGGAEGAAGWVGTPLGPERAWLTDEVSLML